MKEETAPVGLIIENKDKSLRGIKISGGGGERVHSTVPYSLGTTC